MALEVLRMLAAGRSNQAIAADLVVALDTVKSRSVTSWTSSASPTASKASLAARELGLIL
jgi:FixJ family two-component response regulator